MANGHKIWINLNSGTGNLEMTGDLTGVNNKEIIPKAHILSVYPIGMLSAPPPPDNQYWIYPFATRTEVTILFRDGRRLNVELQTVSNQAGWSTGTQAGINQCVADFAAFV